MTPRSVWSDEYPPSRGGKKGRPDRSDRPALLLESLAGSNGGAGHRRFGRRPEHRLENFLRVLRIAHHRAGLIVMPHNLVGSGELSDRSAVFQQQSIRIAEINRTAPFVVDHRRHVDVLAEQLDSLGLELLHVVAPEREVIE